MTTTRKILISAGHSGVFDNYYATAGKRSPEIGPPTMGFFEGEKNRELAGGLSARLKQQSVSVCILNPSPMSVPESAQVAYARQCVAHFGAQNVLLLAIHNNAQGNGSEWTDAHGATLFTRRDPPPENILPAGQILSAWCDSTGLFNRGVQRKNFNILMGAPLSVLLECAFMTNKSDCQILSAQYHKGIAAIGDVLEGWANAND